MSICTCSMADYYTFIIHFTVVIININTYMFYVFYHSFKNSPLTIVILQYSYVLIHSFLHFSLFISTSVLLFCTQGALITIIHIKDGECQVPTCILHQYLKQYSGQLTKLEVNQKSFLTFIWNFQMFIKY